jgi:hypothetical protein
MGDGRKRRQRLCGRFGSWVSVSAPCRETALHKASRKGHTESVKALLEKGAAVNAEDKAKCAFSRCAACLYWKGDGCPRRQRLCGRFGSWVSVSAPCRETALHDASRHGHTESVKALLKKSADVNAENSSRKTAFHVAKDRRAYIAAVEVRCVHSSAVQSRATQRACDSHGPSGSAGGVCSQGAAAEGVFGAVGAGCSQHRCGVWRSLVGTRSCCLRSLGRRWGGGEAAVCAARAQGGAAAVRCGPRFGVRCEGGWRAERRLVGWLVQRSRTGCCSLRPRRTGRKCRRAPVRAQGQRQAFGWMVWVAPPLGLGRSRRVREGRCGAGAAAVECSS